VLNDPYSSPIVVRVIKSRRIRVGGDGSAYGEGRGVYGVLGGEPEGKRPLGKPRRRWENNIRMDGWKWNVWVWTGLGWLRIKAGGGQM
jgi:hypothetical protein